MSKLQVGVIGVSGGIGKMRASHFSQNPKSQVVAVCCRSEATLKQRAAEVGARGYTDWRQVVDDPDVQAVSIATPNVFHYDMARYALERGRHVSVEYPLVQSPAQLDELAALAKRKGVVLHDALTVRVEGHHVALRENLGRLGRLVCARIRYFGGKKWYVDEKLAGNMFVALHIHFVDQFIGLFGEVAWLDATKRILADKEIHFGTILMGFKSGVVGYIEFGMNFPGSPSYSSTIVGDGGYIEFNRLPRSPMPTIIGQDAKGPFEVPIPEVSAIKVDSDNFVAEVVDGAAPISPLPVGRRAIELCLAATESAEKGQRVTV